jgi:hypothetical protein
MRVIASLAGIAAFLLGSSGLSFGMGSGPHPHLLIAIPNSAPPPASDQANLVILVLLVSVLGVFVYFARRRKTPHALTPSS